MKCFAIQIEGSCGKLYTTNIKEQEWLFTEAEKGDVLVIKCVEMTKEDYDSLPEFTGF